MSKEPAWQEPCFPMENRLTLFHSNQETIMKQSLIAMFVAAFLLTPAASFCAPAGPEHQPEAAAKANAPQPVAPLKAPAPQPAAPVKAQMQQPAPAAKATAGQRAAISGIRHGNVQSRVFHNSTCKYYNSKNCTEKFSDAQMARSKGYTPCKRCGG